MPCLALLRIDNPATISVIDEDRSPSSSGGVGSRKCTERCLRDGVSRPNARLIAASSGARLGRLLSVQRTLTHRLGVGFGLGLQRSLAQYSDCRHGAATSTVPTSDIGNLQVNGSLQLPVALYCDGTECVVFGNHGSDDRTSR